MIIKHNIYLVTLIAMRDGLRTAKTVVIVSIV